MDRVKLICCGLIAIQFLFFVWLLSSIVVDGRFRTQEEWNGDVLIFEPILAGTMIFGAGYLRLRQLKEITRN